MYEEAKFISPYGISMAKQFWFPRILRAEWPAIVRLRDCSALRLLSAPKLLMQGRTVSDTVPRARQLYSARVRQQRL